MKRSIRRMVIPIVSCILTLTWFRVFFFIGYVPSSSMEPTIPSKSFFWQIEQPIVFLSLKSAISSCSSMMGKRSSSEWAQWKGPWYKR